MNIVIVTSYFFDHNKSVHYQFFKKHISRVIVTPSFSKDPYNKHTQQLHSPKFMFCGNGAALKKMLSEIEKPIIFCFLSDNICDIKFWLSLRGHQIVVFDYAPSDTTSAIQKIIDQTSNPKFYFSKIKTIFVHLIFTLIKANLNILISTSKYGQFSKRKNAVIDKVPSALDQPDDMENCQIAVVLSRYYFEDDDLNAQGQNWSSREKFLSNFRDLIKILSDLYQVKLCFHPKTDPDYIPHWCKTMPHQYGIENINPLIALGTSSTALSFLKQMGCTVLILGPSEIQSVPHLKRLMISFSSELNAKIVDFDNAVELINSAINNRVGSQIMNVKNDYFKNLKKTLEN